MELTLFSILRVSIQVLIPFSLKFYRIMEPWFDRWFGNHLLICHISHVLVKLVPALSEWDERVTCSLAVHRKSFCRPKTRSNCSATTHWSKVRGSFPQAVDQLRLLSSIVVFFLKCERLMSFASRQFSLLFPVLIFWKHNNVEAVNIKRFNLLYSIYLLSLETSLLTDLAFHCCYECKNISWDLSKIIVVSGGSHWTVLLIQFHSLYAATNSFLLKTTTCRRKARGVLWMAVQFFHFVIPGKTILVRFPHI